MHLTYFYLKKKLFSIRNQLSWLLVKFNNFSHSVAKNHNLWLIVSCAFIAMNVSSFPVVRRRNPLNVRHPNTVKYIFFLHVLVGLGVSCLGLWLCWWAPSTRARENPYWSGLVVSIFQ